MLNFGTSIFCTSCLFSGQRWKVDRSQKHMLLGDPIEIKQRGGIRGTREPDFFRNEGLLKSQSEMMILNMSL